MLSQPHPISFLIIYLRLPLLPHAPTPLPPPTPSRPPPYIPHARPHRLSSILIRSIRSTRITTRDRDVALKVGDTVLSGMKSLGRIAYSAAVPGGGWDCCV